MTETAIDRATIARLAKVLVFICGADHPATLALRTAAESGTDKDIKAARAAFVKLKPRAHRRVPDAGGLRRDFGGGRHARSVRPSYSHTLQECEAFLSPCASPFPPSALVRFGPEARRGRAKGAFRAPRFARQPHQSRGRGSICEKRHPFSQRSAFTRKRIFLRGSRLVWTYDRSRLMVRFLVILNPRAISRNSKLRASLSRPIRLRTFWGFARNATASFRRSTRSGSSQARSSAMDVPIKKPAKCGLML